MTNKEYWKKQQIPKAPIKQHDHLKAELERAWEEGIFLACEEYKEEVTPTDCVCYALVSMLAVYGISITWKEAAMRYGEFINKIPTNSSPQYVMADFRDTYGEEFGKGFKWWA